MTYSTGSRYQITIKTINTMDQRGKGIHGLGNVFENTIWTSLWIHMACNKDQGVNAKKEA